MNKVKQTQSCLNFFLFQKNLHALKKLDLYLRKIQISFLIEKNSDLHLMKMQICFYFEKNLDLHSNEDVDPFYLLKKEKKIKEKITCRSLKLRKRS